ncbi:DUF2484 family protein [Alterinioella nitratireducens]|jgi:hypothetical protein|uniref:DUF2484 family protein n=1 Tax=Alterinioella nitratireducens TaxID=2735915 RepID=UPI000C92BE67|nr:DUF2484 family protein [Alterinioella nitratireducens]MAN13608.1 UDP-N-acetylmuramate--alanine ligase [Dinoroseobacter sp.]NPD21192.1 DUF2484 family protein [Alterinioella nitratireducens]
MTLSLILASVWAILATALAFLPMRLQFAPGIVLLVLALPLLVFIGVQHGPWIVALVVAGIVSMFRRPLAYFARRLMTRMREGAS